MNDIQVAIVECMEVTLAEVRKACNGVRPTALASAVANTDSVL